MRSFDSAEAKRLETATRWLRSHLKRLAIDKKSLEDRLVQTSREVDRISRELEQAETRLANLSGN